LVPFPENTLNIKISITNKNPKKKGFKKILYKYVHVAIMNGEEFAIIQSQLRILETLNIEVGDSFWMKGEVVG
jgi:K+-transporting ATPase A subunit